jgi:aminomethyltransferase
MSSTSLAQKFGSQAVAGVYAGAETVLNFGSKADELTALRHGCGVFDLGWRGKLVLSGEDRVRWLNGMVTNNTRDLVQDFGNYNLVLNAQGRIQGDLMVFQRGEFFVMETEAGQLPSIREFLERYIIMDDVEIGDISTRLTSIGVAGPKAMEVLQRAGVNPSAARTGQVLDGIWNGMGYSLVKDPIEARDWWELWLSQDNVEAFWHALAAAGAAPVGVEALEWHRILLGLPRMGVDTGARVLPQETGQEYALHYTKGCYIGQEIVERIHSRGQVHRRLAGVIVEGELPPPGSKLLAGEKEIGEVTSGAEMVVDEVRRTLALGYVKREAIPVGVGTQAAPGESVTVGGSAAKITQLPFQF